MATRALRSRPVLAQQKLGKTVSNTGLPRKVLGDITSGQNNIVKPRQSAKKDEKFIAVKNVCDDEVEQMETDDTELDVGCLPPGVADIDSKDLDNPQLCAEYATEIFVYLRGLEAASLVRPGHLSGKQTTDKMRAVLVDWLVEVQVQFKLMQETLFSTVDIIDRFMEKEGDSVSRNKLQLVGVAAMFLASKLEEVYAPACSDFVYITDNAYTQEEIKAMELRIAKSLDCNLAQPTAINFLRRYSKAGDVDVLQHSLAKYSLELCLPDARLVACPGSRLAAASLCLSLLVLEPEASDAASVWTPTLAYYSGYSVEEIVPMVRHLAGNIVATHSQGSKLQAVRTKYRSSKFLRVSELGDSKHKTIANLTKL